MTFRLEQESRNPGALYNPAPRKMILSQAFFARKD
jgi:hypothetical protein